MLFRLISLSAIYIKAPTPTYFVLNFLWLFYSKTLTAAFSQVTRSDFDFMSPRWSLRSCLRSGCQSCVITVCFGRMRSPCIPMRGTFSTPMPRLPPHSVTPWEKQVLLIQSLHCGRKRKSLYCACYEIMCHTLCLTCVSFSNSELLLPSRHQSTRLRSALGSTLQRTWTSAAKVGCCLILFLVFLAFLIVSWLACRPALSTVFLPVNLSYLSLCTQTVIIIIIIHLSLRLGGMWIIPPWTQLAAEEHGGPSLHILSSSYQCTTSKQRQTD